MAPSRPHHELHADTHLCPETVLPVNLMSELPYSQLRDRTFGSVQQARVVSKGVHCHGNTVTWALIMAHGITADILHGVRDWLMPSQIGTNLP
jgi:hypothetical protein